MAKADGGAVATGLDLIGKAGDARPTLGSTVPLEIFRALRVVGVMEGLDGTLGKDSSALVYDGGKHYGVGLGKVVIEKTGRDLGHYVKGVADELKRLGVGLLYVTELRLDDGFIRLKVDECITCAGMPNIGKAICHFEAGCVAGILEVFLAGAKKCLVKETKCWALGHQTCEFEVSLTR